ncbi:TetR/AcrR family transcriptional regulator [Vibrio crassostreae]|uniref:TetR/AcrR family transcriptional regulator n=1 Tax=Vibrio crassostreae TaxID=246167 RepID=UPI00104B9141|nr:TetR/AcrR family transcriptional regulator [Vibrio crassostreae]TCV20957.1 TetR family transcriptional regulator [Vibrio crassostreae]
MKGNTSRNRILIAFRELLLIRDYCDITVSHIIEKAGVGKSTFYRCYNKKLDVFIEMHKIIFHSIFKNFNTKEEWLNHQPDISFVRMANIANNKSGNGRSMSYIMGSDWPNASRLIRYILANEIQLKLESVFGESAWLVPVSDVSGAIAALYIDYITLLSHNTREGTVEQRSHSLKIFTQSIIKESLK